MGDYYRRTDVGHISLRFQPVNLSSFDIKNNVLVGLKDIQLDVSAARGPWEHLTYLCETCSRRSS